jgi:hypothetical protein
MTSVYVYYGEFHDGLEKLANFLKYNGSEVSAQHLTRKFNGLHYFTTVSSRDLPSFET